MPTQHSCPQKGMGQDPPEGPRDVVLSGASTQVAHSQDLDLLGHYSDIVHHEAHQELLYVKKDTVYGAKC